MFLHLPPFLPMYLHSFIAPEDRLDFLEAMTKYFFGKNRDVELSQIVKVRLDERAT